MDFCMHTSDIACRACIKKKQKKDLEEYMQSARYRDLRDLFRSIEEGTQRFHKMMERLGDKYGEDFLREVGYERKN